YKISRPAAFLVLAINFFFGAIQDLLKKNFDGSFISKYSFLLPLIFILILAGLILIKKRKWPLLRLTLYLNILFILLLIIDSISLSKVIVGWKTFVPAIN